MKSIRSLSLLMFMLVMTTAWAESINENQARQIAANFMASHTTQSTSVKIAHKAPPRLGNTANTDKAAYYVFNAAQTGKGYVIIAGDDRAPAVLGYSDKGTFDAQDIPDAMQNMLEGYAAQIDAMQHGAKAAPHLINGQAIAPLVTAAWDQSEPYNLLFPYLFGRHAYVGCVATAMAQVMHFWKWPVRPSTIIPTYTSKSHGIYMPPLPIVNFNWNEMHDTYNMTDTSSTAALAAAQLSLYCAQSVRMEFDVFGSGAQTGDVATALINYYGYKPSAKHINRSLYTTQQWESMAYEELSAGRPIVYSGSKEDGGHAFVCDGFDGEGRFHINWGWNGISNGYFLLSVLNPDDQGTGSADGAYGYILSQSMITGIEPGSGGTVDDFAVTVNRFELQKYVDTRSGTNYNFSVTLNTHFINNTTNTISFKYGWGFYQGSTLMKVLSSGTMDNLPSQYYIDETRTLQFGANTYSGTFRIMPIYSARNGTQWRPCVGYNMNFLEVKISGNKCEIITRGIGNTPNFEVNDISVSGFMHPNRPVHIDLNVTNMGYTRNDLIYMFTNGSFYSSAFIDLNHGESGTAEFLYSNRRPGTYNLVFSATRDCSDTLAVLPITINSMPSASLNGMVKVLNVVNVAHRIIHSDKFSIQVTVHNDGSTTYDEDITVKLNKRLLGDYGATVQTINRPLTLPPGESATLQFDLDNVTDGWTYNATVSYYSGGREIQMAYTNAYSIYFNDPPVFLTGDVNNDGEVNITDVNIVIAIILGKSYDSETMQRADVDENGEINISDVNAIIKELLS